MIEDDETTNGVNAARLELVRSCAPNERVIVRGSEWIKARSALIEKALDVAFREAYANAAEALGQSVVAFSLDDIEMGATFLRVTVVGASGRQASGIGQIPDPRTLSVRPN